MKYKITEADVSYIVFNAKSVYNYIFDISGSTEMAIEVSSWCDLASIGETFETDIFTIEVIE